MSDVKMSRTTAAAEQRRDRLLRFPGTHALPGTTITDDPAVRRPTWIHARLHELGVLAMQDEPTRPPGFFINWTTLGSFVVIIAAILGGFWFMYDRIATTNYEKGVKDTENRYLQKQLDEQGKQLAENERLLKLVVNPNEEAKKK